MKKQYISKEDLAKACTLDLFTYFKHYYPDELVKKSRNVYVTKMHDSLNIKTNGLWYWWSHGIGGRSAFKYLRDVEGMDWQVAASYLLRLMDEIPVPEVKHIEYKRKFVLPKKNQNENFIKEYLVNQRYINEDLVESCIMKNLIYEDQKTHAVVFVGYDVNYYPKFACMRSTDSKWKKDCLGSDKRYSFSIHNEKSTNLHVFESTIDLLSFMTILKMKDEEIWDQNYLSIDGATGLGADINDGNIPVALDYFLRNNEIRNIYLHLDNDEAGKNTTTKIKHVLKKKYKIYDRTPKYGKDVNDELIHYIQKEKEMKKWN